jgi:hypothetical protein
VSKDCWPRLTDVQGEVNHMVVAASLIYVFDILLIFVSDGDALGEMNDLGIFMLAGFILAVVVAIGLTIIRLRLREKRPQAAQFISINSREED